jgi:hypothetical protein
MRNPEGLSLFTKQLQKFNVSLDDLQNENKKKDEYIGAFDSMVLK